MTTALIIMDGFGYSNSSEANAIALANTPTLDTLTRTCPNTLISGSGKAVGLPEGQMGNSEVGHTNLGAGRVVYQDLTRISHEIETGKFNENPVLLNAIQSAVSNQSTLHIMGLLSPGGIHSHQEHLFALVRLLSHYSLRSVAIHAFLDGRDTPPKSAQNYIEQLESLLEECLPQGKIVSLVGRYYAMDRDHRWERIEKAYKLIVGFDWDYEAETAVAGLLKAYDRNETDEFVKPTRIQSHGEQVSLLTRKDSVIFMNFRADRARQLTYAFTDVQFSSFQQNIQPPFANFVTLTQYDSNIQAKVAYPPDELKNTLGEYLAHLGKTQLRIAETEKYAHVTFFFSGGREQEYAGEHRILIPSPKVATYDLQPEMSAIELTDQLVAAINANQFDFIVCNYANCDMVGHTGNLKATIRAVEIVDQSISKVIEALRKNKGQCLITADHGNAEKMLDEQTGQAHTAHTNNPVPLIYVGPAAIELTNNGTLSDVSPTLLDLMGLKKPEQMTGHSLLVKP